LTFEQADSIEMMFGVERAASHAPCSSLGAAGELEAAAGLRA